ncbi:hypothetical protein TNCV_5003951 [Trichonephila clavipes]|nr:hypothetical protein TNCV_5003951 [Trichonephila clavipes]
MSVHILFAVQHYPAVRSRLGARGRMTTKSLRYRSSSAVGVCIHFRRGNTLLPKSRLGARGSMTRTTYRSRSAVGVRQFSVQELLCCAVASVHAER